MATTPTDAGTDWSVVLDVLSLGVAGLSLAVAAWSLKMSRRTERAAGIAGMAQAADRVEGILDIVHQMCLGASEHKLALNDDVRRHLRTISERANEANDEVAQVSQEKSYNVSKLATHAEQLIEMTGPPSPGPIDLIIHEHRLAEIFTFFFHHAILLCWFVSDLDFRLKRSQKVFTHRYLGTMQRFADRHRDDYMTLSENLLEKREHHPYDSEDYKNIERELYRARLEQ